MGERQRYRRRPGQPVVAVQLRLDTEGFRYQKWGDEQRCKANDWLVDNDGEVYTVDADSFARSYTVQGQGTYVKTGKVYWSKDQENLFGLQEGEFSGTFREFLSFIHPDDIERYETAQAGWTAEDNDLINRAIELMGARRYKTYRIYERSL